MTVFSLRNSLLVAGALIVVTAASASAATRTVHVRFINETGPLPYPGSSMWLTAEAELKRQCDRMGGQVVGPVVVVDEPPATVVFRQECEI